MNEKVVYETGMMHLWVSFIVIEIDFSWPQGIPIVSMDAGASFNSSDLRC